LFLRMFLINWGFNMRLILFLVSFNLFADMVLTDQVFSPPHWTTATRPICPVNKSCSGFNTSIQANEFWDITAGVWKTIGSSSLEGFVPGFDYKANDLIKFNRDFYVATVDFTAGADFLVELALGRFGVFSPTDAIGGVILPPQLMTLGVNEINVGQGVGVIVDPFTNPGVREFNRVDWVAQNVIIPPTPSTLFYIRVNNLGVVELVNNPPDITAYQDEIIVAIVTTDSNGSIFSVKQHGWILCFIKDWSEQKAITTLLLLVHLESIKLLENYLELV
jgi:hypothetical protein